ncbi:hypothetical protein JCM10295v2_004866 [Rhodotorula toruloides]
MAEIYANFAQELQRVQEGGVDLLDEADGLLARWGALCEAQQQTLSDDIDGDAVDAWTLERNTWALVQALYAERLNEDTAEPSSSKNPYTPPLTVAQKLIEGNKELVELSVIRDWLHSIPSSLNPAEIRRGYQPYTKNKLKQVRRTGAKAPKGLVDRLDPDALLRGNTEDEGARLEADDAAYERALLRSLYEYVRAGELDLAIDMCRQSDQSWRAASLSGGKLWWDPALAPNEEGYDEVEMVEKEEKRIKGNANRKLWKTMCRKLAAQNTIDPYERALYGALSGDVASVLPVCATWEDVVWAHLNSLFESHVEAGLASSPWGRYWQRSSVAPLDPKTPLDPEDPLFGSAAQGKAIRQELEQVFEKLLRSDKADLAASAKNPFHVSQAYLVIGKIDELLNAFVERIEAAATDTEPETLAHLLRFFSHLILVLRLLKQSLPEYAANRILEAYVHVLEAHDQDEDLIAFYASNLEQQSAVESYARFLRTFGLDSDIHARHLALRKSREHGLSLPLIARRTVELTLSSTLATLPPSFALPATGLDAHARVDAQQLELIRSLEWLTAEKETYEDAIEEANALARWFLSTDAPSAARQLLRSLPDDLLPSLASASTTTSSSNDAGEPPLAVQLDIREHLDYRALYDCLDKHARWSEVWARRPGLGASKLDVAQYREGVAALVEDFYRSAVELLEGEWLKLDGLDVAADAAASRRHAELARIRRLVVPDLVFRLHRVLFETSDLISANLPLCLSLANLVADERYQLYLEFVAASPSEIDTVPLGLKAYLEEVRKASLASLDAGRGPFGTDQPTQPGSLSTLEKRRARSRSPSPSPTPSPIEHLAQAGLGLASPSLAASPFGMQGDEMERLADASDRPDGKRGRTTSLGFVEPEMPQRPSQQSRGRERKKSFIGLGFGGGGTDSESVGAPLGRRRISFGFGGGASPNAVDNPVRVQEASPQPPDSAKSISKKRGTSGAKAFLRKARSFGTSPILGSSNGGTFASSSPTDQHPSSSIPLNSPVLPLPRLSTSSLSVDTVSPVDSPAPLSGTSTPLTPHSPYYHNHPSTSSAYLPSPQLGQSHSSSATGSTMVLPEPIPSQPHWLFAPAPSSSANRDAASSPRSSLEQSRRKSADERARDSHESSSGTSITHRKDKAKAKEGEQEQGLNAPSPAMTPKRKTRRATLGGLFGRKEPKASLPPTGIGGSRLSADDAGTTGEGPLFDSPTDSPALSGATTREISLASDGVPIASIPSLPSLPSLQLSSNPYRMSWAFGRESPSNPPEKGRSVQPSSGSKRPSGGERPTLAITTTPTDTPAPASPIEQVSPSRPPLAGAQTLPLPVAPPLEQAKSFDSGSTLLIRASAHASTSPTTPTPPGYALSRGGLSASTPPSLRRSNSYAPPSTSRVAFAGSTAPLTPSPLSSPVKERLNPLSTSSSPGAEAPPLLPSPGSTAVPQISPSLAHTLIKTRAARSHSDASDRRSPVLTPPPTYAFSGRNMVVGGLGIPPGGGYFAQAHQKVGASRPTTADSTTGGASAGGRSSVFGSLGSLFGGGTATSQSMSRSSSAATTGTTGAGTPATSPGLSAVSGSGEVNEFGALFGQKRSSSQARHSSSRRRGLSVGAGIGSFFGGSASTGSASNLLPTGTSTSSASPSPSKVQTRGRSDSASSVYSSTLSPPDHGASVGGRMRALTDPNRRFSFSLGGGSGGSASLAPPGSSAGRPVTADGSTSPAGRANRSRGNSLSTTLPPETKKVRKPPKPRVGEAPEEYVRRLLEADSVSRRASRVDSADGDAPEVMLDTNEKVAGARVEANGEEDDEGSKPLPKGEVTKVLSLSAEPFYTAALEAYLRYFPFHQLALDIALRVFLCSASLPSETQQIDRVMEAFARRYVECNPGLFGPPATKRDIGDEGLSADGTEEGRAGTRKDGQQDSDIPYVLAFSMVMLNTDHFNPNAKSKMTKADYIKNTRIDGVSPEILEYLYDQITLAPFIFVDDGAHGAGLLGPSASTVSLLGGSIGPSGSSQSVASSAAAHGGFFTNNASKGKVDPYHLIATNQTRRFRVDVESHIPSKSPFSFSGTTSFFDTTSLHSLFARAPVLQIQNRPRASQSNSSTFASTATHSLPLPSPPDTAAPLPPSPDPVIAGSPLTPTVSNGTFIADPPKKKDRPPISSLKITKVGLLSRKEDLAEGGKKAASRKWRGWSVVLTGSQLLFFKDPNFAASLQQSLRVAAQDLTPRPNDSLVLSFNYPGSFKPDAVLSLANTAAIYDATYSKYRNVFRLVAPAGRQYLFQAHNEDELNSWLSAINFSAAFKTANIRIRPLQPAFPSPSPSSPRSSLSLFPPHATSDPTRSPTSASSRPTTPRMARSHMQDPVAQRPSTNSSTTPRPDSTTPDRPDPDTKPSTEDGDDNTPLSLLMTPRAASSGTSGGAIAGSAPPITTRADLLRARINNLDAEIRSAKERLQADLRLAKHLAILTPFRSTTRERVLMAIPPIEKRVRHTRMHLAKLICYREVLSRDLLVEDREAERFLRKHSLHRTHSRHTSSVPRQRSPGQHSRHPNTHGPAHPSHLSQSTTSPRRSRTSHAQTDSDPTSFESAAESLSALANGTDLDQPLSLTDNELDRLHVRSPPLMQRSKTETDWQNVVPLEQLSLDPPDPSPSSRLRSNSELVSEDDF